MKIKLHSDYLAVPHIFMAFPGTERYNNIEKFDNIPDVEVADETIRRWLAAEKAFKDHRKEMADFFETIKGVTNVV